MTLASSVRARRRTVLIERMSTGGQIATTSLVENYPGFPDGIGGPELAQRMLEQAERFGASLELADVEAIADLREGAPEFRLRTSKGETNVRALIVTAGADYNKLEMPGEERLVRRGVSYCGTCDAAFFSDVSVAVVGGGDSALRR